MKGILPARNSTHPSPKTTVLIRKAVAMPYHVGAEFVDHGRQSANGESHRRRFGSRTSGNAIAQAAISPFRLDLV
jgi:hypothetical protein